MPEYRVSRPSGRSLRVRGLALLAATLVTVTGCATRGEVTEEQSAGGPSVAYGASQEEYAEALADMEPVTLQMQSSAPQGAATGRRFEAYAEALQEWSGGKINVEIAFSNSIAQPADVDDALGDGRLDLGSVTPNSEPARYPAHAALWDMAFLGRQTPVDGLLQFHAAYLEASRTVPEINSEFAAQGITLLVPAFSSGSTGMMCSEPRRDLAGLRGAAVATLARTQNLEVEAVGGSPTSLTYAELYESLERGVVQCAMASLTVASLQGYIPAAPHMVIDDEVGFQVSGAAFGVSTSVWNSLPLAAQQLMYDRLDVFLVATFESALDNITNGLTQVRDSGGEVAGLDPEAKAAVEAAHEQVLQTAAQNDQVADPAAMVESVQQAEEKWAGVLEEMGYRDTPSYDTFLDEYQPGSIDFDPFIERLYSEVLLADRPGAAS
ncbi:TRAP transporter substrate-binding protein DctP [Pseudonocardia nematodicida]|uniref:TRAP transporter substrate-binding protein DctP n=1 Tax=Pseudonocardia nematodicida TaxID=1206997 RepID=A0ABV1K825_9PSEU